MTVICISGQARNGKDELSNYLAESLSVSTERRWGRTAFAEAVKRIFADAFGVDQEFIEEWKVKSESPNGFLKPVRRALQFVGDGFREIKADIWIDIVFRKEGDWVVSDGRYINEAAASKKNGGLTVLIYRPGFLNDDPNPSESQLRPLIEWCIENDIPDGPIMLPDEGYPEGLVWYDFWIKNDGTLADLHEKIDRILLPYVEESLNA